MRKATHFMVLGHICGLQILYMLYHFTCHSRCPQQKLGANNLPQCWGAPITLDSILATQDKPITQSLHEMTGLD
jgi:hypothetical protein